ncbi:MAG: hypothetical protein LBO74_16935 [Candidatus Symbiothrix sp.]|jgi:hypothetical protein|nr:hypothetical protein [Candidatus Symbiothrix sp.]
MERYANKNGNSPITHYLIDSDKITVWFKGGKSYSYSYRKAGTSNVETMKSLARSGSGLSAYITRNVRFDYD